MEITCWSLMWTARVRRRVNDPCHRRRTHPPPSVASSQSAPQATPDASAGSRPVTHDGVASPYPSLLRQFWQPWQWPVPSRIAPSTERHRDLRAVNPSAHLTPVGTPRWPIWHQSGPPRSGRDALHHAGQRLSTSGSPRDPGSPFAARRSAVHPPRKWDGAHPLRLPGSAPGRQRETVPHHCGDPPGHLVLGQPPLSSA